ncbi:glutamate ABC transporter substrate-binding protein [Amycolatopsis acidiphila]|uniref:Glutamate ABC transporter substrate-binding protein n=1 Tax=Amycolatopsis acidiphila TaxID=715473 RepID=A0A558AKH7_9PSEU|nr:glutamate ABC transporter substrate-binding protein [Amycolatopsis acidiphila]TVT24767.1 glutamate ABC transporter substrate-binding protein [Amycolatopsis acidiphila]UIJ62736.1 glutamate ABC transporter substrate-binding protein [Amycolatopsis acidiphila]GHG63882.1 ABC transporter substrate-binding protein [Amycolatopsis acidiphila]
MRRALALAFAALTLTGCATVTTTPVPTVPAQVPTPGGAAPAAASAPAAAQQCGDVLASLRPLSPMPAPGQPPAGSTMAKIAQRGKLVVGVDQNTLNMGFRDPFTGQIQGFDIDMARAVAQALFGNPDAIQLRALTSDQRVPALQRGDVDLVVRTMTITCDRRAQVQFSAEYYEAQQRILVKRNSGIGGPEQLGGKRVCATKGSTSLATVQALPAKPVAVGVADWTDCLVLLQQGQVDAVSTDDVILGGMAAQDRYTEVVGASLAAEPYGIAVPKGQDDMVRFVNGVLDQVRASGTWAASYRHWLDDLLPGPVPAPPAPHYRD